MTDLVAAYPPPRRPPHSRHRFFVATNQTNSYAVYYFEREEQSDRPSKRKGEIFMSGYSVRSVKREEEIRELGEHALVLEVRLTHCVYTCMSMCVWGECVGGLM